MVDILQLKDPNALLKDPELYENAVGRFLSFLKKKEEHEESKTSICKDITITY